MPYPVKLLLILYLLVQTGFAQNDTATVPYWVDMMQDERVNFFQTQRAFELYWKNRPITQGSGFKAFKRWEYSTAQRTDAAGRITPSSSLYKTLSGFDSAIRSNQPKYSIGAPCYSNGYWKEVGPIKYPLNNTGQPTGMGRINALGFHPAKASVVYAGAPAGGLWVSHNYGNTWQSYTDSLPTLGVSAIAVHPDHPDTLFIGTGDRDASDAAGLGVMWSTDGGKVWKMRNTGMGAVTVGQLLIDPFNPSVLLAATNNGIFRSTDMGASWSQRATGNFKELVYYAGQRRIVFASASGKLYRSSDNGLNWSQITSGLPSSGVSRGVIAVTPADTNYVYFLETSGSVFQGLYRSTDGGLNFTTRSTTPNIMDYSHLGTGTSGQAWYDLDIAADPGDPNVIYGAGVNIFKSRDGGVTWKINAHWVGTGAPSVHADHHVLEYNPHDGTLFSGNDGGVYFQKKSDSLWYNISAGLAVAQIYKLAQSATHKKILMNGYQDNGSARYDGKFTTVWGGDGMDCAIDFNDPDYNYGEIYYGTIFRVRGNTPENYIAGSGRNGITESGAWVTPLILKPDNPGTMFVGYKNVWRSTNIKASSTASVAWTKISDNLGGTNSYNIHLLESGSAQPDLLFMARSDNRFFRTSNASNASPDWTDLTTALPSGALINALETDPRDSNIVYITQSNRIYKSSNRGATWTNITANLPNVPYLCIAVDSSSKKGGLYVGGYAGVFYTDQSLSNWIPFNYGMPKTSRVLDLEIYHAPGNRAASHLVAATYGRGNWVTPLFDDDKIPVAGFEISDTTVCSATSIQLTNTSLNLATRFEWTFSPSGFTYLQGTTNQDENISAVQQKKGIYSVRLIAENCMGADTLTQSFKIEVFDSCRRALCTPAPSAFLNRNAGILNFQLHGKTHSSLLTRDEGSYLDYTCNTIFRLKPDTVYETRTLTGNNGNEYVKGYIDFNDDGDFNDSNELIIQTKAGKTHVDTFRVPRQVVLNKPLRMRLRSDNNPVTDDCSRLSNGQTQDYAVFFVLPVLKISANSDSICALREIHISDASDVNFAEYDWDFGNHAQPRFAKGKGPHPVRFDTTGYPLIRLTVNKLHTKLFDSALYIKASPQLGFAHLPPGTGLCEGETDSLVVSDSKKNTLQYFWSRNTNTLPVNGSAYTLKNATMADSGIVQVIALIRGCRDTIQSHFIHVHPAPVSDFSVNDTAQCFRYNSFQVKDKARVAKGTYSHRYFMGDTKGYTIPEPKHRYAAEGKYRMVQKVTTSYGCADSSGIIVSVYPQPVADFTLSDSIACFRSQGFSLQSGATVASGSIQRMLWFKAQMLSDSGKGFKPVFGTPGTYSVQHVAISGKGCTDTQTRTIRVFHNPVAKFRINQNAQCVKNNKFDLTDLSTLTGGNITRIKWTFGDGDSAFTSMYSKQYALHGPYTLTLIAQSDRNCRDTTAQSVSVFPQPIVRYQLNDPEQCLDQNVFIFKDVSSVSGGSLRFQEWQTGDGTRNSTAQFSHTYAAAGKYLVVHRVETDMGCWDTVSFSTDVHDNPVADCLFNNACAGDTVYFKDQSSYSVHPVIQYRWYPQAGTVYRVQNPWHIYVNSGVQTCSYVVEDSKGCMDSVTKTLQVFANPVADFRWNMVPMGGANSDLHLTDQSSGGTGWLWNDGRSNSAGGSSVVFSYKDSASVKITLLVSNAQGCTDTVSKWVYINPVVILHIPTGFSPNGDQLNDVFIPQGAERVKQYYLVIFNRWGEKVFETTRSDAFWDGNFSGKELPAGAYPYFLELTDYAGNRIQRKGAVQLIR